MLRTLLSNILKSVFILAPVAIWIVFFVSLVTGNLKADVSAPRVRYEKVTAFPQVVRLRMPNASCSGFIIAKNIIMTAAHCVARMEKDSDVLVYFQGGRKTLAKVLVVGSPEDISKDFAVLSADTADITPFKVAKHRPKVGTFTLSLGHPDGDEFQFSSIGKVVISEGGVVTVAGVVYPGESGGALISVETFEVVGLISRTGRPVPISAHVSSEKFYYHSQKKAN